MKMVPEEVGPPVAAGKNKKMQGDLAEVAALPFKHCLRLCVLCDSVGR